MNDGILGWILLASLALFFPLLWAHRSVGTALLATVFAPLVLIPMGFVSYMAFGLVLRAINAILAEIGSGFSTGTLSAVAAPLSAALFLVLFFLYCRDQRGLSKVKYAAWLGTRSRAPEPRINLKGRLR